MTVFARTLVRKGGSLATTIPSQVAERLKLNEGDQLVFVFRDGKNYAIIGTADMLTAKDKDLKEIAAGALGAFGSEKLEKEEIRVILKEMAKEEE